jgi:multidrug efflux pump subunit AcrB
MDVDPAPPDTVFDYQINALGRLSDPQQFGDIVLRAGTTSEATLRLRDVARIELGALLYNSSSYLNDNPSVGLVVYQTPTANALGPPEPWRPFREKLRVKLTAAVNSDRLRGIIRRWRRGVCPCRKTWPS